MCWVCDSVAPQCPHCDEARYHDALLLDILSIGLVPWNATPLPRTDEGLVTSVPAQEQRKPEENQASQERQERARHRAECAKEALQPGKTPACALEARMHGCLLYLRRYT